MDSELALVYSIVNKNVSGYEFKINPLLEVQIYTTLSKSSLRVYMLGQRLPLEAYAYFGTI